MKLIKLSFFLVFLCIFFTNIFSQFYADIKINVYDDGKTLISGTSNSNELIINSLTHKYTSKKAEYWLLNISTNEFYDDYIFELTLPKNSQINYIKTTKNFRIDEDKGRIKLIGIGEKSKFKLIVQYKIKENLINLNQNENYFYSNKKYLFFFIIIIFFLILFFKFFNKKTIYKINKKKTKKTSNKKNKNSKPNYDFDIKLLSPRQQDIINILIKKGVATQKEIEKEIKIPKSSVSRNIRTLEIKGIIKKERSGNTNYIKLNSKN